MSEHTTLGRRERNKQQTRLRLLDATRHLFAERGAAGATIEDIADLAGVSRATVFNYFPSKDDLIVALHASHMDALAALIDDLLARPLATAERIVAVFDDFARESRRHSEYMRAFTGEIERDLVTPSTSAERTRQFEDQMLRILEPGIERGEVRTDYPLPFLAQMVGAVYVSTVRHWRQNLDDDTESFYRAAYFAAESLVPRKLMPQNAERA